jgi:hypothetical protein
VYFNCHLQRISLWLVAESSAKNICLLNLLLTGDVNDTFLSTMLLTRPKADQWWLRNDGRETVEDGAETGS